MNIEAFYKITYGLYLISAAHEGHKNGYVANTVFQVTAFPPQFAISCNKDNLTSQMIRDSKYFSVSVLEKDTPAALMGLFGFQCGRDVNKFEHTEHFTSANGTPIVTEHAVAWFECRVMQTLDIGSHLLFIGEVIDNELSDNDKDSLTYTFYREIKKGTAPKNAPTYIDKDLLSNNTKTKVIKKYKCSVCGYIYDPESGDPDGGIAPGTSFEDIPDDWKCPVCGVTKSDFVEIEI